jgi:hypothetical protein
VSRDFDDGHFRRLRLCGLDQRQGQNALEVFGFFGLGSIQGGLQQSHAVLELAVLLVAVTGQMLEFPDVIYVHDLGHELRPAEMMLLQALVPKAEAVAVPAQHLDGVAPAVAEYEEMSGKGTQATSLNRRRTIS